MHNLLERFFELSVDLLVVGSPEGRFVRFSPSWSEVLGWSMEELPHMPVQAFLHPDDFEETFEATMKMMKEGRTIARFQNRYRHKNGSWRHLLWTGTYDKQENLIYAIAKDITETISIEEKLKQSERRLNDAQKTANIGSWELNLENLNDINSNPLHWSDQVFRIFGHEPGQIEVSNETFFNAVHPEDRDKIRKAIQETLETGKEYSIEHRILLPDGTERFVLEKSKIIYDKQTHKPKLLSGTVQDITENKKLLDQLIAARKMESIGRLAGGIAHDFNNLLASMYGNLEFLVRELPQSDKSQKYIKNLQTTAKRAADLTRQLLAFSRQQAMSPTVENLNNLVLESEKILGRLLSKHISFQVSLAADIGLVEVDSSQILQIILNLSLNARDAMPNGGTILVETSQTYIQKHADSELQPGDYVSLRVSDTGMGMDSKTLERIFEPFFTTKGPGQGTGLGLATVYGIVKQSGGHISVTSEVGKGSVFEILLPVTQKKSNLRSSGYKLHLDSSKPQKSILLIEDELEIQKLIRDGLEEAGFNVQVADSGDAGLEKIKSSSFDLLITDYSLPGKNGIELIKCLRSVSPQKPAICISGYPSKDLLFELETHEARFLQKPFSISSLVELAQNELQLSLEIIS